MRGVVNYASGFVRTDMDTVSAAYTHIMVYHQLLPGTVHAELYGAACDAGITVNTFFFINPDYRR
jgi:hypothetical protein